MKILAVDDEPFIREMIPLMAVRLGFPDIKIAPSGKIALDMLVNADPAFDCLLLDINMPEIDGIELCRIVRKMKGYQQTPIIMLTAMSDKQFIDRAFQAGATDYATKPFDLTELGARLRMAKDLIIARREAETLRQGCLRSSYADGELLDSMEIGGVPKLVDLASLKNYLSQLSRTGASASQIAALGLDRVRDLEAKASAEELKYALHEVASAISFILAPSLSLMAYCGGGVFLVVSSATTPLDCEGLESEVQYFLDERNLQYDDGSPMNFEILMGAAIRPMSADLQEIDRSIARAVARLTARTQTQLSRVSPPNVR